MAKFYVPPSSLLTEKPEKNVRPARPPAPPRSRPAPAPARTRVYTPPSSLYTEKPEPNRTLTTGDNPRGVAITQPVHPVNVNDKIAIVHAFHNFPAKEQRQIVQGAINRPNDPLSKFIISYVKTQKSGSGAAMGALPAIGAIQLGALVKPRGALSFTEKLLTNAAKDAWGYIPQTLEGGYGLGKDIVTGHEGNAVKMLADPFIQLAEHPVKTFESHPFDTAMMVLGAKAAIGKSIGGILRRAPSEALRAAGSTARDPLHLGTIAGEPSPITEARSYSNDYINKALQRSHEKIMEATKGYHPNIARPKPRYVPDSVAHALRIGVEAKLRRVVDEEASGRQGRGRALRAHVTNELRKLKPSKAAGDVVPHVLQGVIRRPDTAIVDADKEITRLKAAQTGRRTLGEIWNRKQVKALHTAIHTPGALDEAFDVAAKVRPTIHEQDMALVQKGLLTESRAMRAKLFPYAIAHMGAKFDYGGEPTAEAEAFKAADKEVKAAEKRVGDAKVKAAEAKGRTKSAVSRQQGIEANRRARGGAADRPLPKAMYERIDRLQRQQHAAEDGVKLAKRDHNAAKAARKELKEHKNERTDAALVKADGSPLPTDEILDHLKDNKVPDPAYVGHYPGKVKPSQFYEAYKLNRPHLPGKRTGAAFTAGHYDHTYEGLVGQVASRAEKLSNAHFHDRLISRLGVTLSPELIQKILGDAGIKPKDIAEAVRTKSFTAHEARLIAGAMKREDYGNDIPGALHLAPISPRAAQRARPCARPPRPARAAQHQRRRNAGRRARARRSRDAPE